MQDLAHQQYESCRLHLVIQNSFSFRISLHAIESPYDPTVDATFLHDAKYSCLWRYGTIVCYIMWQWATLYQSHCYCASPFTTTIAICNCAGMLLTIRKHFAFDVFEQVVCSVLPPPLASSPSSLRVPNQGRDLAQGRPVSVT